MTSMKKTLTIFQERKIEIESYIELIQELESALMRGMPIIESSGKQYRISPLQQRILSAGVFLHLYNLVEATICNVIEEVENVIVRECGHATKLSARMHELWIRSTAKTHEDVAPNKRLSRAIALCNQLTGAIPLQIEISKGGGGNWDDIEIEELAKRLGVSLNVPADIYKDVKRHLRDEKGALKVVRDFRNSLAHGSLSFAECGDGHSAKDLNSLFSVVASYLEAIISAFDAYLENKGFLETP